MNVGSQGTLSVEVEAGVRLAVTISGASHKPPIVFSNSLATSWGIWDEAERLLAPHARLIRYDARGHGLSDTPETGYSIEKLGRDVLEILDSIGVRRAVICGISLGGLTAMWLGINAPDRVSGLILANTAPNFPPQTMWQDRAATARSSGLAPLVQQSLVRWVTDSYRRVNESRVRELATMISNTRPVGYAGCCDVLATTDILSELWRITCSVRVIAGRHDLSTPVARAEEIVRSITHADLVTLEAAHISCVEAPNSFAEAVCEFLGRSEA